MRLGDILPKEIKGTHAYVKDFEENMYLNDYYKIKSKRMIKKMDGREFLIMTLCDKSGCFRVLDYYSAKRDNALIKIGDIIKIKGTIESYQGNFQIVLPKDQQIEVLKKEDYDIKVFISETDKDIAVLKEELLKLIKTIKNDNYKNLLNKIFNPRFLERFLKAPAAIHVHHAYIGGLIEHTLEVAKLCDSSCSVYKNLNRDLVVTGALLHDIGKVEEFLINDGIEKSDSGEFLGHIFIGAEIVKRVGEEIKMDKIELDKIVHIILSHHGEIEWGSPVTPRTKEAQIVFAMDNLSAKIQQFTEIIQRDTENGANWSEYDRRLERRIWLKTNN